MELSDKQIIGLIVSYDRAGIEALFYRFFPLVSKIAYIMLKDEEKARDLGQELFLKIWSSPQKLKKVNNLKRYLIIAIKNDSLNYLRKESRNRNNQEEYLKLNYSLSIQEDDFDEPADVMEIVSKEISHLAPKCRLIFALSRFEGLTNQEISDYLQISKATVEKQLYFAMRHLREKLKGHKNLFCMVTVAFSLVQPF